MIHSPMVSQPTASLVPVADGVFAWIGRGGDSNAGVIDTPTGLIVIDAQQTAAQGKSFRQFVEHELQKPVRRLINTHFHLDHVAGNVAFSDVATIAHERTVQTLHDTLGVPSDSGWEVSDSITKLKLFFGFNIEDLLATDDVGSAWFMNRVSGPGYDNISICPPTESFADRYALQAGKDIVRCEYWGAAHCDGDLVVHLPRAKVVFLGDLLFVGRFPWFGDCDLEGWVERLDRVLQMDVETVIPGHGPPSTLREVAVFRDLLLETHLAVRSAVRRGLSEDATVAEVVLPQFASMPRYDAWMPFNLRATYRMLRAA
ncbi:MBL fold metallo-hydrolase [Beijerinckia sp. L45]|uniref:MBL fold metallo-hydrolase n=1 Tax=Beijerinckia sp. L45 TaxID=1641855 RepID=UPI00131D0507|nr:MBL fold metallo-hydrolase [Beijerinckia sp. L45]